MLCEFQKKQSSTNRHDCTRRANMIVSYDESKHDLRKNIKKVSNKNSTSALHSPFNNFKTRWEKISPIITKPNRKKVRSVHLRNLTIPSVTMAESPIPRPNLIKGPQHPFNHLSDITPGLFLDPEVYQAPTSLLRQPLPQRCKGGPGALHLTRLSDIVSLQRLETVSEYMTGVKVVEGPLEPCALAVYIIKLSKGISICKQGWDFFQGDPDVIHVFRLLLEEM